MAPHLENHTPFPAMVVEKHGHRLRPFDVLVVRGTFDLVPGGRATPCDEQGPIEMADRYAAEPPERSYLLAETDLVLGKKSTDVVVRARAHAPGGKAVPRFLAGLSVGPVQRTLGITGPRRWETRAGSWRLTEPAPACEVPITYDLAFGGAYPLADVAGMPSLGADHLLAYPENGAGCGWLPTAAEIAARFGDRLDDRAARDWARAIELSWGRAGGARAPQIEDPRRPIASIGDRPAPEGTLPVARFWRQRLQHAGTYDEAWRREIWPSIPDDFDFRFYQHAHPGLVASGYLAGDEAFATKNLSPEGELAGRLPAFQLFVVARDRTGLLDRRDLRLDTVVLDLEARTIGLTWRCAFPEEPEIEHLLLAALVPPPEPRGEGLFALGRRGGAHG